MFKHLLCYFGSLLVLMVIYVGGLAIGTDLFSNKILVGAKLQSVQGWLLGVDDSYVTEGYVGWLDDNAAPDGNDMDREELSQVSLRHHSQSRVGDAMYRAYRDSAMIISLVEEGLIIPLGMVFTVIMGMVVIAFFDPWVVLMLVLIAIPILWITVVFTPRIRRLSVENRVANANLTSQLQETFSAVKVVKLYRAEDQILDRFNHDSHRALDAAFTLRMEIMVLMLLVALLGGTTLFIAEYVMVNWVIDERDTFLGAMVATLKREKTAWSLSSRTVYRSFDGLIRSCSWNRVRSKMLVITRS
ncbi:MAG: ABC transporter ATP-binding protein [Pseudomonadales bacterium]|nr:ABC transporter ATP-binding protein [Pseudomonadales bacterium]